MATTHNTATVKLRLDLGELITQLRDLADTLETTQMPKADDEAENAEECKHEAWDVHPNGITRHCSDCRATMAELMAAGKFSDEAAVALCRKLAGQPEPSHFIDGTKPARNPHTLDLPEGMDPAKAQHMLDAIADAQSGRTDPVLSAANRARMELFFIPKPRNLAETLAGENVAASRDLDPQPLRCPQCDDPWRPRAICPTCGCDHRRAYHGADPR